MLDLFGIKKRKLAKFKKLESHRNLLIKVRKNVIIPYLDEKKFLYRTKCKELQRAEEERVGLCNSSCPNCGGSNVINKFVLGKGNLFGQIRTSPMLKVGGTIKGSYDTLPVNECADCGNQWEKATVSYNCKEEYPYDPYPYSKMWYIVRRLLDFVETEKTLNIFDIYKIHFRDTPREVMEYLIYQTIKNTYLSTTAQRCLTSLSAKYDTNIHSEYYNDNEFLWTLKDSLWEHFKNTVNEKTSNEKKKDSETN